MKRVGIIGGSGFTGAELMRILHRHPEMELVFATGASQAGQRVGDLYPNLGPAYPDWRYSEWSIDLIDEIDGVFLALPHGESQKYVPSLIDTVPAIVDLGADFRLRKAEDYVEWYGEAHTKPDLLDQFVYGLPELFRNEMQGVTKIASPGCYPTSGSLGMAPLVRNGLVKDHGIVIDAVSGLSGAGRPPKPNTTFCAADSDVTAYGLLHHRHTPEMEYNIGASVLFTPHLVPMSRGILATCYGQPAKDGLTTDDVLDALSTFYADEPFVWVTDQSPSTKATMGSNMAHLTARVDPRSGMVMTLCALDNLGKGASGAAVQNMNIALGVEETAGLELIGMYP